jgi:hypothetical protein
MTSKSFWISVVVGCVITTLAIVGVVVGLIYTAPAPVLRVCWEGDRAVYSEKAACPDPEELIWAGDQLPISALPLDPDGLHPLPADDQFTLATSSAIKSLNLELRLPLFSLASNQGSVAVREVPYERSMGDDVGVVQHTRDDNGHLYADVKIRSGLDMPTLHEVLRHELLHVVGMGHDDYANSTMFPITPEMLLSDRLSTRHVADRTIEAIRARYGRSN